MKSTERIIGLIAVLAVILKLYFIPGSGLLTVLSFSILSCFYFYFGLVIFNNLRLKQMFKKETYSTISSLRIIGAIATGLALSMIIIGLLFRFQFWPNADINIEAGLLGAVLIVAVSIGKSLKDQTGYYKKIFIRFAIIGSLGLSLILAPRTFLLETIHRNHPAYVQAMKNLWADPNNKEVRQKFEEERDKLYHQ